MRGMGGKQHLKRKGLRRLLGSPPQAVLILALAFGPGGGSLRANVFDRIAAVVQGHVITLTDLLWLARYKNFQIPEDEQKRRLFLQDILQQLIDQKLIEDEALRTPGIEVTSEDVDNQVRAYRQRFPTGQAFQQRLQEMNMNEEDLRALFRQQLAVLDFIKVRIEPFVIVLPDQIQDYYQKQLLPKLRTASQVVPSLSLVREQIREILTTEKTNQELDDWVDSARKKADVNVLLFRTPSLSPNLPPALLGGTEMKPVKPPEPRR